MRNSGIIWARGHRFRILMAFTGSTQRRLTHCARWPWGLDLDALCPNASESRYVHAYVLTEIGDVNHAITGLWSHQ